MGLTAKIIRGSVPGWVKGSSGDGNGYGYGYGNGYGNGYGDGNGNGDGYGNGDGNGYGYGDGNGYGYGYGNGYGYGYGNGDGNGYGYGDGNGYGNGYGCQEYQRALFLKEKKLAVEGGCVTLYKSVDRETRCDFRTGTVKYEGVVELPDHEWDSNPDRECGGGLHLSATPDDALGFNRGLVLRCRVRLEDFLVYRDKYEKVRCRRVEVLGEV